MFGSISKAAKLATMATALLMATLSSAAALDRRQEDLGATMARTAQAYIDGFNHPGDDGNGFKRNRSDNCQHFFLPDEIFAKDMPDPIPTADAYVGFAKYIRDFVVLLTINRISDITTNLQKPPTATMRMQGNGILLHPKPDAKKTSYTNEYDIILQMNDAGTLITRINETVDPDMTREFFANAGVCVKCLVNMSCQKKDETGTALDCK